MPDLESVLIRKSREESDKCKDFILEQVRNYLMGAKGDPSREMVIALAEAASDIGFNAFGKDFVQTLFNGLAAHVGQFDDDLSLRKQLLAAGFNSFEVTKTTKN